MPDLQEITDIARKLGIKLTSAEEGSELFECWRDRVLEADGRADDVRLALREGDDREAKRTNAARAEAVLSANAYAI